MTGYTFLDEPLREVAEKAKGYFSSILGIPERKFVVESPVSGTGSTYRMTFHTTTREQRIVCVDVASSYTDSLAGFVLACVQRALPVELSIAVPFDSPASLRDIVKAADAGIGVISMGSPPTAVRNAIPLSLAVVRRPNLSNYPKRYAQPVNLATQTFLTSDPIKGVAILYDEIEAATRRLAIRAEEKGCWKGLPAGATSPGLKWDKAPWANLGEVLVKHLNAQKLKCPLLTPSFLGRILGLADPRNEHGHKPKTLAQRVNRDSELRTRFEATSDLLKELLAATSHLKL